MKRACLLLLPLAWPLLLAAQTGTTAIDTVDQNRPLPPGAATAPGEQEDNQIPELFEGEINDLGPQFILTEAQVREILRLYAEARIYYTTNLLLSEDGTVDGNILLATIDGSLWPVEWSALGGSLEPYIGFSYQWLRYGVLGGSSDRVNGLRQDQFDFDGLTPYAGLSYTNGPWFATVAFEYTSLRDVTTDDFFYQEYVPWVQLGYGWQVLPEAFLSISYDGRYRFTDTDPPLAGIPTDRLDRTDHALNLIGVYSINPQIYVQGLYRLQYTAYTEDSPTPDDGRSDVVNTLGLSLNYSPIEYVNLSVFTNFQSRLSDARGRSFTSGDLGGGLSLSVAF